MGFRMVTVVDRYAEAAAIGHKALHDATEDVAEDCLQRANVTIPLRTGAMMGSGFVEVDGMVFSVGYDTDYAVIQHEDSSLHHAPGRRDHWLSQTIEENAHRWEAHLATELRSAFVV